MLWRVQGAVVFWANRSVGVLSCPAPGPRPAPPPRRAPRSDPPVVHVCSGFGFDRFSTFGAEDRRNPASSIFDFRFRRSNDPSIYDLRPRRMGRRSDGRQEGRGIAIPGHALHEKVLRTEMKRRRSTGQQPKMKSGSAPVVNRTFCFSIGLHRIWLLRASEESFRTGVFDALEGTRGSCPWANRSVGVPSSPAPGPRPAPPPRRAPRSDPPVVHVCSGFGFDKFFEYVWRGGSSKMGGFCDLPAPKNEERSIHLRFSGPGTKNPLYSTFSIE